MDERRNQQNRQPQQSQGGARQPQQGGSQQGSGQGDSRQQQQFDTQGSRQAGGSSTANRFADQIREHMEVIDSRGQHYGTVDHVDADQIKLTRSDSSGGQHQYLPLSQVAGIEGNKVRLR
jgi:hypothetical protein